MAKSNSTLIRSAGMAKGAYGQSLYDISKTGIKMAHTDTMSALKMKSIDERVQLVTDTASLISTIAGGFESGAFGEGKGGAGGGVPKNPLTQGKGSSTGGGDSLKELRPKTNIPSEQPEMLGDLELGNEDWAKFEDVSSFKDPMGPFLDGRTPSEYGNNPLSMMDEVNKNLIGPTLSPYEGKSFYSPKNYRGQHSQYQSALMNSQLEPY